MNMPKYRDIQAKMHLNDKNSQSVFLSFKCILARNCEGTEQLRAFYFLCLLMNHRYQFPISSSSNSTTV